MEPAAGRLLEPADDAISPASPAAVISYRYWQRRFGLNPAAIGKTFTLQEQGIHDRRGHASAVPGNAARAAIRTSRCRWSMMLSDNQRREDSLNMLSMMGRLAPGVTIEQANAELQVIWQGFVQRLAAAAPEKGPRRDPAPAGRGAERSQRFQSAA